MSNPETDHWNTHGRRGDDNTAIRFKKSEPHSTQWTINDVLGDDPLLRPPVASELDISSSGSLLSHREP